LKWVEVSQVGAGRGNSGGLSEYAKQLGKNRGNLTQYRAAAQVVKHLENCLTLNNFTCLIADYMDKAGHLYYISQAPSTLWPLLCERLITNEWSVNETKDVINYIKESEIPSRWE